MGFWKWLAALVAGAYLLLLRLAHAKATSAHASIEAHRLETKKDVGKIYDEIQKSKNETYLCRKEIEKDMQTIMKAVNDRMSETQIKDFVDREIRPINGKLGELSQDVKDGNSLTANLITKVQVLLDRDNKKG